MMHMTSIVTVTFNSYRCLQRLRKSLRTYTTRPYEWILVDNGSTRPETMEELVDIELAREAQVIYRNDNAWFTHGCNEGIAKASGDLILLLNPDCEVRAGWLEAMQRPLAAGAGVVGAYLVDERGRLVHAGGIGRTHRRIRLDEARATAWKGWVTGACLLVSRQALDAVGGQLDERYPHYDSDRVLCEQVREAGFSVWLSDAQLLHSVGGSGL